MDNKNGDIHTREDIEDDLLVADYVAGRLDDEAKALLEARIGEDDDLLARVIEERGFRAHQDTGEPEQSGNPPPATETVKRASPWRLAAIAATLIAAAFVVFYNRSPEEPVPPAALDIVPVESSDRVRIVFSGDASEADRSAVTDELGLAIVWGPIEMNAYIGDASRILTREELESWAGDPRITLIEPVDVRDSP